MELSATQIFLIFIISCLIGMDSILDEFQFHRPIVACTLIGMVLGNLSTGIILGSTLEMISLGWMNVGAAISPDTALASIVSSILVIAGKQDIGTGIAIAIPIAAGGQALTVLVRTIAIFFQRSADKLSSYGHLGSLTAIHMSSLFLQAFRIVVPAMMMVSFFGTSELKVFLESIPTTIVNGLNVAGGIIVVVGYAMVINMMYTSYLMPFLYLGFIISAFTDFNLIAIGSIGVIMSIIYIQLNPKYVIQKLKESSRERDCNSNKNHISEDELD
ncbi:PTS mannose/fructose/sorbose transporter subunit IIC [Candidatus Riesia pediculicola]|uniref:Fructose permease IIC component n=1 Tax=Riesia pediculicola (strain USDA) TaxID=515618 RepID=D4G7R2_RIEPU|nr:PTS mannose/fructose/sorbose transporter subunit IIC [Candidatus Riesia pediculicola]ADD79641.1 fructose permease IIC component [Candidatus Riesia pediculicola USDA]QOJ86286.1 PTS mannose/fructose/sorbose transporter subunit IIC [Candidatus Riesia pediculicola]